MLSVAGTFRGQGSHVNDVEDEDLAYILKARTSILPRRDDISYFNSKIPRVAHLRRNNSPASDPKLHQTLYSIFLPSSPGLEPLPNTHSVHIRPRCRHDVGIRINAGAGMHSSLKVDRRQKIMVLSIFGCGLIATIASILALVELPLAINDPDKTWGSWRLAVYAAVQNNLGIIAASAPALKPLLGKTFRVVRSTVGSKLSSNTRTFSKSGGNGKAGGGESRGSSGVKKPNVSSTSAGITVDTTSQSKMWDSLADNERGHGFFISGFVKKILSPRGSVVSQGRSSINQTGGTSYHTAPASGSYRESAILDTIGILPTEAAFPKNASGNRRTTRVFAGNHGSGSSGPTEIHHIRDWQLDQNDYCLDPSVEHNLPQRPRRTYNRISIGSSSRTPEAFGNGNISGGDGEGKFSQVESIGSIIPPIKGVARIGTLETCGENGNDADDEEEAGLTIERILSHEEWKKSGGYGPVR
ncbi:hypothetical protein TWF718_001007 [Orbilia javanica]|uniref:Rhodopsin domain-containing protein n=1 Tax=Orbilia javanica TaxID=47235 RepID=A0AAN8RMF6_9PEZI